MIVLVEIGCGKCHKVCGWIDLKPSKLDGAIFICPECKVEFEKEYPVREASERPINRHLVSVRGDNIIIMRPPSILTKADALEFAAWIVALADDSEDGKDFDQALEKVQNI